MAERGRDLTDILFGTGSSPAATVDQWRQTLGLDDLERQHGLPQGLMTSIMRAESAGDPRAENVGSGARGLFQFIPRTAEAYKIDPYDPQQAAPAAAKELSSLYRKYGGDLDKTLAGWNWGQGRVDKFGMEKMPAETRGFLSKVKGWLSPASAEAATPQGGRDLTHVLFGDSPQAPARSRLEELEAELARRDAQQPPTQAPARSRLEELEAELARRDAQRAPAAGRDLTSDIFDTPPQATETTTPRGWQADIFGPSPQAQGLASAPPEEPITPERRFLDLPSVQALPLEERTQRFTEFYRLRPDLKEEFLRSEEPPSDLTIDIEKPSPPAPTGWRAQLPQTPEEWDRRMAPMQQQVEAMRQHAPAMALSMVPGALGYTLGAKIAPTLGAIGKVVPPLLEAAGGYLGRRAGVALGTEQEGTGGDLLSLLPLVTRGLGSATAGWLERTITAAPVAARDQTLDLLGKLFSRGGVPASIIYGLTGDPHLAAWIGGSAAVARQLLEFGLRHPAGKQLVEQTLKAGRAIGGAELGMLLQIGRTGKAPAPGAAPEQGPP